MTSRITRAFLGLSAIGLIAATAAISSPVQAAACTTTTKIALAGQSAAVGAVPFNVAIANDIDAKYCIDLSVVEVVSGSQTLANLVGGTAQVTVGTVDNFMGWNATAPMTVFREVQTAPFFDVVVRKDYFEANLKGKTFADQMKVLAGAKLGVTALGGASEATWRQLITGAGTSLTGTFVAGQLNAATIGAAFTAKSIDATITWEPNTTLLTEGLTDGAEPLATTAFNLKEPTKDMPAETNTPGLTLGGTSAWFAANQSVAKQLDAMFDESIAYAKNPKNFAKVVSLIQEKSKISNKTAISLAKRYLNYFNVSGAINRAAWDITGPWYFKNLPAVVKNISYTSNNFVYDLSLRQIKALKVGRSYDSAFLAKSLNLTVRAGSTISVTTTTSKVCTATKTGITGKAAGSCDLTVTVTDKKAVGQQSATRFARTFLDIKKF